MIRSIGLDVIEHSRFDSIVEDRKKTKRFLSKDEQILMDGFSSLERKITFLSGRFAAKESIIKALTAQSLSFSYVDISILPNEFGSPIVHTTFSYAGKIHLSITHSKTVSAAVCIIEEISA